MNVSVCENLCISMCVTGYVTVRERETRERERERITKTEKKIFSASSPIKNSLAQSVHSTAVGKCSKNQN